MHIKPERVRTFFDPFWHFHLRKTWKIHQKVCHSHIVAIPFSDSRVRREKSKIVELVFRATREYMVTSKVRQLQRANFIQCIQGIRQRSFHQSYHRWKHDVQADVQRVWNLATGRKCSIHTIPTSLLRLHKVWT